ncbi:hypothetical protein Lfu02_07250 [Longispora fulva]|uniref:Lipoprotein n=1 Tax=Longispora fulva TaxID=619741 RepID=A0A8J7GLU4_9ACTN|nr:hypothetical protein [Longispora fulva]MBG6135404.1 hypothetical protein [Longispora fulva]GIG56353.1 hypothetical protein Lfu02_07250 [Longispora fulva]
MHRIVRTAGIAVLVPLALAGCGSSTKDTATPPPATTAAAPSPTPKSTVKATPAAPGVKACPVDAVKLLADLKTYDAVYIGAGAPEKLEKVACQDNFAIASAVGPMQSNRVVFGYDATKKVWQALTFGAGTICTEQYVPAETAKKLNCQPAG